MDETFLGSHLLLEATVRVLYIIVDMPEPIQNSALITHAQCDMTGGALKRIGVARKPPSVLHAVRTPDLGSLAYHCHTSAYSKQTVLDPNLVWPLVRCERRRILIYVCC
jgi:hypothetical protein